MERTKEGEFCWVDLMASDLDKQTAFYEGLFGWTHEDIPTPMGPIYRMFLLDGARVAAASQIGPDMAAAGVPSMWNTYLATGDADALAAKAVELGGKVIMPAMDVMEQGRMVAISDPQGGAFFLWQAGANNGAQVFMKAGSQAWNDLTTRDPKGAAEFYSTLFGWQIKQLEGGGQPYWQVFVDGEGQGGIMPMPEDMPAEMPPFWLVYFGAEDAHAATEKAAALGGSVTMAPTEVPGMLIFSVVEDPGGATFAILQGLSR